MADPFFMTPVSEDDPCGPDSRWDPAFIQLTQALDTAMSRQEDSVVDAQLVGSDEAGLDDIVKMARDLGQRTKDLRVLGIHAVACWHEGGLRAFAEAMETLVRVTETWPDHQSGVHPRADPEDGDLGERAAPLGKLLNMIPALASTLGWGARLEISERLEVGAMLRGVFEAWTQRLEPALDRELPPCRNAWAALLKLVGDASESQPEGAESMQEIRGVAALPMGDAWDIVERAAELMVQQDRHSPALPVLRVIARWRSLDIMQIAQNMKGSGITLEQLLDATRKQLAT